MSASKLIISANLNAFLDMLATSEGTIKRGDDGYNVIVGGTLFSPYAEHPNVKVDLGSGLISTAAGRYQFLHRTWIALAAQCGCADFSPVCQDTACIELIRQRFALDDVQAGRFDDAVAKCRNIWASLPGAGYGQRENSLDMLRGDYEDFGGTVA